MKQLTPRQNAYLTAYTDASSSSFGNSYMSALSAGYTSQTARNLSHLNPAWRSENIGQLVDIIGPDQIMEKLTQIIGDEKEPTIVKLKAIEMTMKAYSMLAQRSEQPTKTVTLNLDLTSGLADNDN